MNNIDIVMVIMSIVSVLVPILTTVFDYKELKEKYVSFKKIQSKFESSIKIEKKIDLTSDEINDLIIRLTEIYSKMLESKEGSDTDVYIDMRKFVENNSNLIVVFRYSSNGYKLDFPDARKEAREYHIRHLKQIKYVYINGGTELDDDSSNEIYKLVIPRYNTYLCYPLKKHGNIVGILNIASQRKVNERYSYENIRSLIESVSDVLTDYVVNYPNNQCQHQNNESCSGESA